MSLIDSWEQSYNFIILCVAGGTIAPLLILLPEIGPDITDWIKRKWNGSDEH